MKQTLLLLISMLVLSCSCSTSTTDAKTAESQETQLPITPFQELYANGKVKIKGQHRGEMRVGKWEAYFEDGKRWTESTYIKGKREGRTINYHENGSLRYRGQYMNDAEIGLWTYYDEQGKVIKEVVFDQDGTVTVKE